MWAWRRTAVRQRVIVNLTEDRAFDGVLWATRGPLLVLKDAHLLSEGAEPTPMDGDIVIERDQVQFVQVAR